MLLPNLLMWAAATSAAVWKTSQVARHPHDRGLRLVAAATLLVFVALSAQLVVNVPGLGEHLPGQLSKLAQNVVLTAFFTLLIVLLRSNLVVEQLTRRSYLEIALALATSAGLVATWLLATPAARGASYTDAARHPAVLAFYLIGNLYMLYATARGAYLTWHSATHIHSHVRYSLRVAAAGLTACCLGVHVPRVLATSGLLTVDSELIPGTAVWTSPVLAAGITVFFAGIGYPGVRTGFRKTRLWFSVRSTYRQLRPLWAALHHAFPNTALLSTTTPGRERVQLRQIRIRLSRRIIECRDGLVSLNAYLPAPIDETSSSDEQARLVAQALTRRQHDTEAPASSVIAHPGAAGWDRDVQKLLELAHAFARLGPSDMATSVDHSRS